MRLRTSLYNVDIIGLSVSFERNIHMLLTTDNDNEITEDIKLWQLYMADT